MKEKVKIVNCCPVCKCKEKGWVDSVLGVMYCKHCGCLYMQVINYPAEKGGGEE